MILSEFLNYCSLFIGQSVRDRKNWKLVSVDDNAFLRLRKTLQIQTPLEEHMAVLDSSFRDFSIDNDPCGAKHFRNEICSIEYHVVFSESYGVPVLLFNIYSQCSDRVRMNMKEAWDVLALCKEVNMSKQFETLTMVEHPLLFQPYLSLHPCKTREILSSLKSENPIITFLSTYGRFISLEAEDLPSFD